MGSRDFVCPHYQNPRFCHRYRRLIAKCKNHNVVITAIAHELAGFIWAIARAVPIAV